MEMPRGLRRKDGKEVFQGRLERVCFDPRSWVGPSRDRWGSRINVTFSELCLLWVRDRCCDKLQIATACWAVLSAGRKLYVENVEG
jgi:hypothetical protein